MPRACLASSWVRKSLTKESPTTTGGGRGFTSSAVIHPMPTQSDPIPSRFHANLWKLCVIRTLFSMHFFGAVLTPFFLQWGGLNMRQVFLLNAWFMFWNFVLEVPTGTIADFFGRKVSLALGGFFAAAGALVYISQPNFIVFMAAEVLFATAFTLMSGADEALAYDSLKECGRADLAGKWLSRLEAFKLGGINAGGLLGAFFASHWSLTTPMMLYAIPALLAGLLALTLHEPPIHAEKQGRRYHHLLRDGARYFVQHPFLLWLSLDLAITNALAWAIIWLYQPKLAQAGVPIGAFGLAQAAVCLAQILYLHRSRGLEQWLGSKERLLTVSTIIAGAAFMTLGATSWLPLVLLGIVAAFAFSLPRVAIYSSLLNDQIPSDKRATVLSFSSMCRTLAIVLVNPLCGWMAEWSVDGCLTILGVLLCALCVFPRRKVRGEPSPGATIAA